MSSVRVDTVFLVLDRPFLALRRPFQALDAPYQVLDAPFQVLDGVFQALRRPFQVLDTPFQALENGFQGLENDFQAIQAHSSHRTIPAKTPYLQPQTSEPPRCGPSILAKRAAWLSAVHVEVLYPDKKKTATQPKPHTP